jgi:hypothetical protein
LISYPHFFWVAEPLSLCYPFSVLLSDLSRFEDEDSRRWAILNAALQERMAADAFLLFRTHGIEPILIKGPAAGIFYPRSNPRNSIDLDLAVSGVDYKAALELSRSKKAAGLAIDVHNELRHLDTRPWEELFADSQACEMGGQTVRVLRAEDHLRVLAVHWLNDGAGDKDRLWDIYFLIANRPADFDWEAVFEPVSPKRQRWIAAAIGLANQFLGLDISDVPAKYRVQQVPSWLSAFVEKEWKRSVRTKPLHTTLKSPGTFIEQFAARLRMNPVWATIHMEGSFDAPTRLHYRIGSALLRIPPSLSRICNALIGKG